MLESEYPVIVYGNSITWSGRKPGQERLNASGGHRIGESTENSIGWFLHDEKTKQEKVGGMA